LCKENKLSVDRNQGH